jgi:hypothetical protein
LEELEAELTLAATHLLDIYYQPIQLPYKVKALLSFFSSGDHYLHLISSAVFS